MATVLLANNYITTFNSPRESIHTLIRTKFFPSRQFFRPLDSVAMWIPVGQECQLIHSFNRIPFTQKPWIISFESFLPRTIGPGSNLFKRILRPRLALDNCRKIIAISEYAKRKFVNNNTDWELVNEVIKKMDVVHPNLPVKSCKPKTYTSGKLLELVFVGNDFARKGGIVALRLAKKASQMNLPIKIHLVSKMNYGSHVYTDCLDSRRYDEDLKSLKLNNIVLYNKKSNAEVIQLLSQSHLQLMATLDDTYGFSVIEGFSVATPAITTNVCALSEIVHHGENGYLLNLALNENRNWVNLQYRTRQEYWDILDSTYNQLTEDALELILNILAKPEYYEQLSAGALTQAYNVHDSKKTGKLLDDLYSKSIQEVI